MKRIMSWLAGVVAALAVIIGVAIASYVGPGSLVTLPSRTVDGGSPLLVVAEGLTRYAGTTMRVAASTDHGPLFVGAGHPVDVTSYVGNSPHALVEEVTSGADLKGRRVGDAKAAPSVDPNGLDIWTSRASGTGHQFIDVALDGRPVNVVVRSEPGAEVAVQLGATVPGLFGLAVTLAIVGALVIALLLWLRRSHRARSVLIGGVGTVMLSGCVAFPSATPAPQGPPTKVALAQADVARMMADYDTRNNSVIAGLVKKLDPSAWDAVDSGPVLAEDRFGTALDHVRGDKQEPFNLTHEPELVYAPALTAYPLWAMVTTTTTATPMPKGGKPVKGIHVFQRASASSPWKMHLATPADVAPSGPLAGALANATKQDLATGVVALKKVSDWYENRPAVGLTPSASMTTMRTDFSRKGKGVQAAATTCQPYLTAEAPERSIRVVRTAKGALTMMTLQCQVSQTPARGYTIGWNGEYAKALGTTTAQGGLFTRTLLVTVTVETRGAATTGIGADSALVRVADQALQ